ncbi:MAG TPA: hypothetical protein VKT77_03620 [Chthonomonadaceae bacterium]|nr:hypothetical protein [Chthonomonadaceae bacterium]
MIDVNIRPINTEDEYKAALAQIEPLMDAEPGSEDEAKLELLSILIIDYEKQHFDMRPPSLPVAIAYHIESRGLTREGTVAALREAATDQGPQPKEGVRQSSSRR